MIVHDLNATEVDIRKLDSICKYETKHILCVKDYSKCMVLNDKWLG